MEMEERFDKIDVSLESIGGRVARINGVVGGIQQRLNDINARLALIEEMLVEVLGKLPQNENELSGNSR